MWQNKQHDGSLLRTEHNDNEKFKALKTEFLRPENVIAKSKSMESFKIMQGEATGTRSNGPLCLVGVNFLLLGS
jgi:hypothetical protein